MKSLFTFIYVILLLTNSTFSFAGDINVAVAGNFFKPLKVLISKFELQTGHRVLVSVGSTGKLYAQISNGAPFDLFLATDQTRPSKLIEQKLAVKNSQFTYAKGKLVLWSSENNLIDSQGDRLLSSDLIHLAIANPDIAPYGEQAVQVLKNLNIYQKLSNKLVLGQNVGQVFQYVSSGNIKQGIIPLSQVTMDGKINSGSAWIIPSSLYHPIQQDAVLLNKGKKNPIAESFLNYLKTPEALQIISSFGYEVESNA
ncbi:molybdate ABC transporter substrate-binding protein [Psychromonas sp. KJ10-10]|uniref:molybdate ABC transporter substrate-binding protein n=1 Tax=Psychromonas sp. KJ10-10 TaxID=3391823 RepID=UPI0039B3C2DB